MCTYVHVYVSTIVQTDVYKGVLCVGGNVCGEDLSIHTSMLSRRGQFCLVSKLPKESPRCAVEVEGCAPKNNTTCVPTELLIR